jgi:hypothetical protein
MDLGNKSVKDFKTQTKIEMTTPQNDATVQALEVPNEGLQNDKEKTPHPTIIPTNILLKHKRPKHHNPDIIYTGDMAVSVCLCTPIMHLPWVFHGEVGGTKEV